MREKGSNNAANEIAKNTISILNIFNDAIADWDIEKSLMKAVPVCSSGGKEKGACLTQ